MSFRKKTSATLYHYDPLDRLMGTHSSQRFYNGTRIATEINGERKTSFFEHQSLPLAERHLGGAATLMATDFQKTVLHSIKATQHQAQTYSPYGHRLAENEALSLLGFNGERKDTETGHYILGNGYRAFNPVLMRFNSPDSWSPFGDGGLNAYAYCAGDPVNRTDSTGHSFFTTLKATLKFLSPVLKKRNTTLTAQLSAKSLHQAPAALAREAPASTLGAFEQIEQMPHVMEAIVGNLYAKDIVSLSATSSKMFSAVNDAKHSISRLFPQGAPINNINQINKAWDIATGKVAGTTPTQLKDVGINAPRQIPHIVNSKGFSTLEEVERRSGLYEKAMALQKKIRKRLD